MKKFFCIILFCMLVVVFCVCTQKSVLAKPLPGALSQIRNQKISQFLFNSASFTTVQSGDNQNYSYCDLDLDGEEEQLSFLMFSQGGQHRAELCVSRLENGIYRPCAVLRNTCDEITDCIPARLAENMQAIVLGWGLSGEDSRGVSICTLSGDSLEILYGGHYTALSVADFDTDGYDEILIARAGTEHTRGSAVLLDYVDGVLSPISRVQLSAGLNTFMQVQTGSIGFEQTALICEGFIEDVGYVSDYIVFVNQKLVNIFLSDYTGISSQTLRPYPVWSCDIDGNGYIELPVLREVPRFFSEKTGAYTLWFVDWMQCGDTGIASLVCTSYHDFEDEWYLILPDAMSNNVTVEISLDTPDCKGVLFYYWSDEGERTVPIWEVYIFRGEEARTRMQQLAFDEVGFVYPRAYSLLLYHNVYGFSYSRRSLTADFCAYGAPELTLPYAELFDFSDAQRQG